MSRSLDHRRANHAHKCLNSRIAQKFQFGGQGDGAGNQRREAYSAVIKGAAMNLRCLGLLQLTAFWLSKYKLPKPGTGPRFAEVQVAQDLYSWFVECPVTQHFCQAGDSPRQHALNFTADDPYSVVEPLLERTTHEIRLLEAEGMAYLAWLARLTEGYVRSLEAAHRENAPGEGAHVG